MSETKMRVSADELAAIVSIPWREGERYTFDRVQTWHDDGRMRAVFLDREGEPGSVVLRRDVDPLLDLVRRLARDLAEEREAKGPKAYEISEDDARRGAHNRWRSGAGGSGGPDLYRLRRDVLEPCEPRGSGGPVSATKTWSAPVPEEEVAETLAAWRECSSAPLTAALLLALSVKVQWIDDDAAKRVTPGQAEAYMRRTGWRHEPSDNDWTWWDLPEPVTIAVPRHHNFRDYGRRMSDLIRTIADIEHRSPLAVWLDLLAEAP